MMFHLSRATGELTCTVSKKEHFFTIVKYEDCSGEQQKLI